MWILNWLPDFVFHLILIVGVLALLAGWALRMVPVVAKYSLPIQVVGVLLTILGVWYEGGIAKDAEWKARVAELETKVAQAEVKSATVNTKVVTKVVTKTQVIKEKGDEVVRYIDREVAKYDAECKIPLVAIKAHDASAMNKAIDEIILNPSSVVNTADHNTLAAPKAKKSWREFLPK
jgi:hypothetical protein